MHAIRSAARKQAWYKNNDDGVQTYNFFGRSNPYPRRPPDEEQGGTLHHASTENDAPSPIEQQRQAQYHNASGSNGVKKSDTFPSGPSGDLPHWHPGSEVVEEKDDLKLSSSDESPTATHATTGFSDASSGTRKRKAFAFLHLGHKDKNKSEDNGRDLDRAPSRQSSKGKKKTELSIVQQLKVVFSSWINILLVFVPVGLAFEYANLNGAGTFVTNFLAIVPLASMLSFATEEVAMYTGETLGGLLNATFGNATELIVSVIALTQHKITIVQTSLIGSILSNLLLVMGMCFFFGGVNRLEQFFNVTVAQTAASLLALSVGGLVTPTAYRIFAQDDSGVTPTSRAAAVLLLWTYICYLIFQLRTHLEMYNAPSQKVEKQNLIKKKPQDSGMPKNSAASGASAAAASGGASSQSTVLNQEKAGGQSSNDDNDDDDEEEGGEQPQLSLVVALCVLAAATALIAVTSDGLVSSIDTITQPNGPLSEEFVGLILVPIVGNAAEHATAVTVAIKDKMDLAIGVAVGSSLQIALLVIPLLILLNWFGVGSPSVLDLNFDGFQIVVLFIAIILVNYVIQDGRSHWLEGMQLFIVYFIFAVAAWYYPAQTTPS